MLLLASGLKYWCIHETQITMYPCIPGTPSLVTVMTLVHSKTMRWPSWVLSSSASAMADSETWRGPISLGCWCLQLTPYGFNSKTVSREETARVKVGNTDHWTALMLQPRKRGCGTQLGILPCHSQPHMPSTESFPFLCHSTLKAQLLP